MRSTAIICALMLLASCKEEIREYHESDALPDYFYDVNNSAFDRCETTHCTCKVTKGNKPSDTVHVLDDQRRHLVYFSENDFLLNSLQRTQAINFIRNISPSSSPKITIIGYADGCGSAEYNNELSLKRARSTSKIIKSVFRDSVIDIVSAGEKSNIHLPEVRRVDIIVHTKSEFITRIEKVPADVYLIDASGSMWGGWRNWNDMINASLKPEGRIYVSMMKGCSNGQPLSGITPQSGTEIWYSYWKVIDNMRAGETLAIISDFKSNIPLTRREASAIDKKANDKNINVIMIR